MDDDTPLRGKQLMNLASLELDFDKDFQVKGFHTNIHTVKSRPADSTFSRKNITQTLMSQKSQSPTTLVRNNVMRRKQKVLSPTNNNTRANEVKAVKRPHAESFLSQTSGAIGSSTGGWTTREAASKQVKPQMGKQPTTNQMKI